MSLTVVLALSSSTRGLLTDREIEAVFPFSDESWAAPAFSESVALVETGGEASSLVGRVVMAVDKKGDGG